MDVEGEMQAFISLKKEVTSESFNGQKALGYPLTWYKENGYSDENVAMIEKCHSEWDNELETTVYFKGVKKRGWNDHEANINETTFQPKQPKQQPSESPNVQTPQTPTVVDTFSEPPSSPKVIDKAEAKKKAKKLETEQAKNKKQLIAEQKMQRQLLEDATLG